MGNYSILRNQHNLLQQAVEASISREIDKSEIESKHICGRCLKVEMYTDTSFMTEIVYLNGRLCFLDEYGLEYNLYVDLDLDGLIRVLEKL